MNWLALLLDLLQVAAPIVQAHSTGKTQEISSVVSAVVPQLGNVVTNAQTGGLAGALSSIAQLAPGIVNAIAAVK